MVGGTIDFGGLEGRAHRIKRPTATRALPEVENTPREKLLEERNLLAEKIRIKTKEMREDRTAGKMGLVKQVVELKDQIKTINTALESMPALSLADAVIQKIGGKLQDLKRAPQVAKKRRDEKEADRILASIQQMQESNPVGEPIETEDSPVASVEPSPKNKDVEKKGRKLRLKRKAKLVVGKGIRAIKRRVEGKESPISETSAAGKQEGESAKLDTDISEVVPEHKEKTQTPEEELREQLAETIRQGKKRLQEIYDELEAIQQAREREAGLK